MSYTVCLIGNSHLAALAQAWRNGAAAARGDLSMVFFGSQAGTARSMALKGGTIAPRSATAIEAFRRSSGGKGEIVVADYDAFVLYGMGFRFSDVLPTLADYGTVGELQWGPVQHLVSESCRDAMLRASIGRASALSALRQIRSLSSAPVLLCPMPFRAESWFRRSKLAANPRLSNTEFLDSLVHRFVTAASEICAECGGEFVPQDESTCALPGFTKVEFSVDGDTWKVRGRADDKHMNARYGAIALTGILQRLDALSGGRVLQRNPGPLLAAQ
jgi:hypothetical protein